MEILTVQNYQDKKFSLCSPRY